MIEMVRVCNCETCTSEADMIVACKLIEVEEPYGVKKMKQPEIRTYKVCGEENGLWKKDARTTDESACQL